MWRFKGSNQPGSSQQFAARNAGTPRRMGAASIADGASRTRPSRQSHDYGWDGQARPAAVKLLVALLLLLAVNALYGGGALIADPSGGLLGMPVSLLADSPFHDYLVPGLVLLGLLGLFPLAVAWALWLRPAWVRVERFEVDGAWLAAHVVGVSLVVWILVQMTILRFFLQPVLLLLGFAIIGVGLLPAARRHFGVAGKRVRAGDRGV